MPFIHQTSRAGSNAKTMAKISEVEVNAAAQTALAAKNKATEAKKKADEAGGVDPELNKVSTDAQQEAADAESHATDLSQKYTDQQKAIGKMKAKKADIEKTLKEFEDDDDPDEDDDDEEIDPDKPLTLRDLQRIEAGKAHKTAKELADAVADPDERKAIQDALRVSINPAFVASNPQQAFEQARAIANGARNAKIIEEANRRAGRPQNRASGSGAPAKVDDTFEPTAEEQKYMKPPFNMTKEDVLAARG